MFSIVDMNNFRGDLTEIKTETLGTDVAELVRAKRYAYRRTF